MEEKNDSLLEIALREMKNKKKPRTLENICKDVFEIKGIALEETEKLIPQFKTDFMLSGLFVCCGEDKKTGNKLWDLKNRQLSSFLEKEGSSYESYDDEDEDVIKNELKDDDYVNILDINEVSETEEDEDEDVEEVDEIEEELRDEGHYDDGEETQSIYDIDEDEDDEDKYDDEDK